MLELRRVEKRYGPTTALHATDLTIPEAQTTVLIGPSGCGKSTLLRLLIGLIEPTAGEVLIEGDPLTPKTVNALRHRMGYVIQDGGLFPHLTARGNATLLAKHLEWNDERCNARLKELAQLTHLPEGALDRYPAQLSGGQRQRVSLMRALMLDPPVLLLDEPLGALDPIIRSGLQEELREIFRALHKTVVMVTHDLAEAAYFADAIVLMRRGRIAQRGSFRDLMKNPAEDFVSDFVRAQRAPLAAMEVQE